MIFFDPPPAYCDGDQSAQRDRPGVQHRQDEQVPVYRWRRTSSTLCPASRVPWWLSGASSLVTSGIVQS